MSEQITEFLAMGGHGAFIWPAYLIATVVLLGLLIASIRTMRDQERVLQQLRAVRRGGDAPHDKVGAQDEVVE
ncbi:MAG: heme exporter protein CcmD [Rhodospirillaceae bacterium]|jgi:heme exporter protein D|nr:heme exporter protein CcmD [Rhodospirillaceae bacterium]MBT5667660.1 heme exporter protein CcmD [Rhodospirillaceae bacterium]